MSPLAVMVLLLALWIAGVSFGAGLAIATTVFITDVFAHAIWKAWQS